MVRRYRRGAGSEYGRRSIRVRVKATPRRRGYVAIRRDIGRLGIGPKLIPIMEKGSLTKHGYSTKKSEEARHRALNKAVAEYGALSVFRKLKAQETLRKRTQPKTRDIFAADADWVREQFKVDGFAS
jgi:hypothetical protein